jgi:Haem degrading protein HbpS-like
MHLNYFLAVDGVIASRGGIPLIEKGSIIGAIGVSGGTDSQDEIVSKAGAAVINQLPATNKLSRSPRKRIGGNRPVSETNKYRRTL